MTSSLIPVVTLQNGKPMCNSRDVSALFGKRHADVLRVVDGLECSLSFRERNFAQTEERQLVGAVMRPIRSFDMTKDGFVFLVMGFTGKQAAAFKEAYINRFNEMEETLRSAVVSTGVGRHVMREFTSPEEVSLRALATERGINYRKRRNSVGTNAYPAFIFAEIYETV